MIDLDGYRTHWQWYRSFFSLAVLRYFVLWFSIVPVVLHLFSKVPLDIEFKTGTATFYLHPGLPFSWVLLWIASVFYTSALVLFVIRCPDFIKKYPSFSHYREHMHSPRWLIWLIRDVSKEHKKVWGELKEKLIAKGYAKPIPATGSLPLKPQIAKDATKYQFDHEANRYQVAMPITGGGVEDKEATAIAEREIFWEVFGAQSGSRAFSRGAIRVLLFFALALFVLVLIQHISAALPHVIDALVDLILPIGSWITVRFE
jgi:hypothetical protein